MNKQEFKKVYHNFRREQYVHNTSDRSHLPCGDQDAVYDRHCMFMDRMMDAHPVLRAIQAQLDGKDQLAWKAQDPWNLKHHYRALRKKNRWTPIYTSGNVG